MTRPDHVVVNVHLDDEISEKIRELVGEYVSSRLPTPEGLARLFHETYERLAPSFSYETRRASAVPWDDVPEPNRLLMIAVAEHVLASIFVSDDDT